MQVMEGVFSLAVFFSVCAGSLLYAEPQRIDTSLYREQLAIDAWRVLYLRGDFEGLDLGEDQGRLRQDLRALGDLTGLCFFVSGADLSNCPGGDEREVLVSLARTVIDAGAPKSITFSMQR